jgi:hypothetical protein
MRMKRKHVLGLAVVIAATGCGSIFSRPAPVVSAPAQRCHSVNGLPDSMCTPGAVRTTDRNIICNQGTKQFRPPTSYTNNLKIQQIKEYGFTDTNPSHYEEDHLISLELGGDGFDPKNLWPEPHTGLHNSFDKDKIENLLHKRICIGVITPKEAQKEILNWISVH